jgi:hypothetical protein
VEDLKEKRHHDTRAPRRKPIRAQHCSSLTAPVLKEDLTDREKRVLRAIQADPEARKSFEFLSRKTGLNAELLTIYFVQEAWGPLADSDFGNHEEWRKLKSLAERLIRLADRIKDANQLPDWRFTVPRIDLVDRGHDRVEAAFKELPELLMLYARNMHTKVETIRRVQKESPPAHGKALELEFADAFVKWIKTRTGRCYRDRVVAVQRVTYREAGRTLLPASGETLRKRDFRKRKRSSL